MNEIIRSEQDRIDNLDAQIDKSVQDSVSETDYSEVIFDQVDELVSYMQVLDAGQQQMLQTQLLGILEAIDSENLSILIVDLESKTNEWMSLIDSRVETQIDQFDALDDLGLDIDAKRDYVLVMKQKNVDPKFVAKSLVLFDELTIDFEEESYLRFKFQVLGLLVNGERTNFIPSEVLVFVMELKEKQIASDRATMESYLLDKQSIEQGVSTTTNRLIQLSQENNEWFSFMDEEVDREVAILQRQYENLSQINEQISELDEQMDINVSDLLLAEFLMLRSSSSNSNNLLIEFVYQAKLMAPNNLPPIIEEFIDEQNIENTGLSEFEKGIILNDFERARLVLEQQMDEVILLDSNNNFSLPDLFRTYRDVYASESQTASDERYLLSSVEVGFGQGTDARRLIDDGYKLVQLTNYEVLGQPGFEGGAHRMFGNNLFLVKQMEDGSFNYVSIYGNGSLNPAYPEVLNVTADQEEQMVQTQQENHENLQLLMSRNPVISDFTEAVSEVNFKLNNLRTLLFGLIQGEKTQAAVDLVRSQALELQNLMRSVNLESKREAVLGEFEHLSLLASRGVDSEIVENIQRAQESIRQMYSSLNVANLDRMFNLIQSSNFSKDNWFLQEALPMLSAVAAAVLLSKLSLGALSGLAPRIIASAKSGGSAVNILRLVNAASSAVGGLAGSELTNAAVDLTTDLESRSHLAASLVGRKIYNPETGQNEEALFSNLADVYGAGLVANTQHVFTLMTLGAFAGGVLSKFATNHALNASFRGSIARGLQKIPRIGSREAELLRANGSSGFMASFMRQFREELVEEAIEAGAYQINSTFGFLTSVLTCTRINHVRMTMAGHNVVSSGVRVEGDTLQSNYTYDAESQETILSDVQEQFPDMQAQIDQESGVVIVETQQSVNGTNFTVQMKFQPSNKPVFVRQLESGSVSGVDASAQQAYGLSVVDNVILYESEGGGDIMPISRYIASQGGVMVENADGTRHVRFGNQVYSFASSAEQVVEQDSHQVDTVNNISSVDTRRGGDTIRMNYGSRFVVEEDDQPQTSVQDNQVVDSSVENQQLSPEEANLQAALTGDMEAFNRLPMNLQFMYFKQFQTALNQSLPVESYFNMDLGYDATGNLLKFRTDNIVEMQRFAIEVLSNAEEVSLSPNNTCTFKINGVERSIDLSSVINSSFTGVVAQVGQMSAESIAHNFSENVDLSDPSVMPFQFVKLFIQNENPLVANVLSDVNTVNALKSQAFNYIGANNVLEYTLLQRGSNAEKNIDGKPVFSFKRLGGGGYGSVSLALYFDTSNNSWQVGALKTARVPGKLREDMQALSRFFDNSTWRSRRMARNLRSITSMNQPVYVDVQQEFVIMETFDSMSDLNFDLRSLDASMRLPAARSYMTSIGSVLSTMESLWGLGLFHGDLKPQNAMTFTDSDGRVQTLVIDTAPRSFDEMVSLRFASTPTYAIALNSSSLDVGVREDALNGLLDSNDTRDVSNTEYFSFHSGNIAQTARLAIGFDMYSIVRMIDDHMIYHNDLYTAEQQEAWNNLKQMSGDMNVLHSRRFLTDLRTFIESTSNFEFGRISRAVRRQLPN